MQSTGKSQSSTDEAVCRLKLILLHCCSKQHGVSAFVRLNLLLNHLLQCLQGPGELSAEAASLDQISVDVGIWSELVLLRQLVDYLECCINPAGPAHQLDQDRQGEVAGRHTCFLHLLQHLKTFIREAGLRTTIKKRVVHDLIRYETSLLFHLLDKTEGRREVTNLTMTFQHGAVGDDVWLDFCLLHVCQNFWHSVHATASSAAVQEGVVCHD
mmetsp:Transcript_87569/g.155312  ORF Transcript_87569/g.155312 Transcript_87569/m.155312 type:complete len:213 (-) Transcript_87569:2458-3096(-)